MSDYRPLAIQNLASGEIDTFRELSDGDGLNWNGPATLVNAGAAQLTLAYESALTNKVEFEVSSGGDLTITPSGGDVTIDGDFEVTGALTFTNLDLSGWLQVDLYANVDGNFSINTDKFAVTAATGAVNSLGPCTLDTGASGSSFGGTVSGAFVGTIGATGPSSGAFTTLSANSNVTLTGQEVNLSHSSNPVILITDTTNTVVTRMTSRDTAGQFGTISAHDMTVVAGGTLAATWDATTQGFLAASTITASGILSTTDATDATSSTAASLKTAGGIACVKSAWIGANLNVEGTGPHAIGGSAASYAMILTPGSATLSGSAVLSGWYGNATLTAASLGTTSFGGVLFSYNLTTENNTKTYADLAQLVLDEPSITKGGTDTITNASTLLIAGAPGEGLSNWALRSITGAWYNGGSLTNAGNVGIGATASANADLKLEAGRLMLKESATPTADANYGKIYTKNDNYFYAQTGDGVEHRVTFSDYASIGQEGNTNVTTIQAAALPVRLVDFSIDGPDLDSESDSANNRIVVGKTADYRITVSASMSAASNNKIFRIGVRSVSPTTQAITAATAADPCVITVAGHGLTGGEHVYIDDVVGMVELNGGIFKVVYIGVDTFSLAALDDTDVDATGYTAYTSGGTIQEVESTMSLAHTHQEYLNANKEAGSSVTTIAPLTEGQLLMVFSRCDDDGTDCTCGDCYLNIQRA